MGLMKVIRHSGQLNKRAELLEKELRDSKTDGWSTEKVAWIPIKKTPKIWARITPINGKERFNNNRLEAEISHEITIRYRKDITRTNRVRYQNRTFKIQHIINADEANRFLVLHCVEEV